MTFNRPTYRNSFHLGWLLLLVPPLAALFAPWWNDNPPKLVSQGIRLILSLAVVVPLFWLRSNIVTGRTQRLLKELRTLMPGYLNATVVPALTALLFGDGSPGIGVFGVGCLQMALSVFGSEFEQRTINGLLVQPLPRGILFLEKMGMLGLLLLFACANMVVSFLPSPGLNLNSDIALMISDIALMILLIPVFAFCSGPLFSLLSRSTQAGMIFTFGVPLILWLGATLTLQAVLRFLPPGVSSEAGLHWLLWIGTPVYLLVTSALGWRVFQRLEVRDGGAGGRSNTGLHPVSLPVDRLLAACLSGTSGGAQLIRKELRLHVVPWLVAGIMVGLWILLLVLRLSVTEGDLAMALNDVSTITGIAGLLGIVILVSTGAACVAEERELGTLEWQLTQPVPLLRQWLTKVAVAAALALGLGVLLPATLVWASFDPLKLHQEFGGMYVAAAYAGFLLMVFATSTYASSIARNTMMAVGTAMGIGMGFVAVYRLIGWASRAPLQRALSPTDVPVPAPAWAPSQALLEGIFAGFVMVAVVLLVVALLWLGGRNCRRLVVSARDVSRQLVGVASGLVVVLGVFGAIMVQLATLSYRGNTYQSGIVWRANAVHEIQTMMSSGRLTEDMYQRFSVPTNAIPEAFLDAVIAMKGPSAVYGIEKLLYPPANPPLKRNGKGRPGPTKDLDPAIARRFGLLPRSSTEAISRTNLPAASTNPPAFKLDPALMKRYGLQP